MTQEVPTPPARVAADASSSASDAAKEARLLSQLLLRFSVSRQHAAVAALFPRHIEPAPDGHFAVVGDAEALGANVHAATDAALASSLLRSRPSERELVQQFLLLPQPSRNKVAQSLFVVPPSLLEDFAVILEFFLRVVIEAHSDSRLHHYDAGSVSVDDQEAKREDDEPPMAVPEKTCSWAKTGDVSCVSYEPDESQAADAGATATAATTAVFTLPPGFQACLVETYGSVHRSKCEEVWHGDHMAYRCRTCGLSDSSCMCLACFDPEDHEGHDYRVYRCSSGGCCDCGDPLAWKPEGFCKKHRQQALDDKPQAALGALEHAVIYGLVRRVVAFCMNALREVHTFCLRPGGAGAAAAASFDAFYPPAQTMRSLPKTGRRRSSFPSVMQVHLDRLQQCLAWLQSLAVSCLPYRQIVTEVFLESLPPDFQLDGPSSHPLFETFPPRPLAILDVFLKAGVLLPVEICDTLGVLYLKLLFDQPFKQQYTCHFVDWYPYFIELYLAASEENNDEGMRNLSRFIDRLFCQLFHSTAQLRELERASTERAKAYNLEDATSSSVVQRLLKLLLRKLIGLFKNTLRVELVPTRGSNSDSSTTLLESVHVVDCGRNVFKKRVYARLCSDIRTLLVHPLVAADVLLGSFDRDNGQLQLRDSSVYALLIQAYEVLQQMDMQQRHVHQHIEFESQNWTFAFVVDYEMNLLLGAFLAGLPYCFQNHQGGESAQDSGLSSWDVATALVTPLRKSLLHWSTRSGSGSWTQRRVGEDSDVMDRTELGALSRFYQDPLRTNEHTPRTAKKSSFHLPLHHMFAAVFKGVSAFVELRSLDDWARLLFDYDCQEVDTRTDCNLHARREDVMFLYQVAEYPLRVATFAREIKAGLWVRNGNVMWQQLVHYYAKHWRYYGLHGDIFVSQLSALMLPRGSLTRMLIQHQIPLVSPLLDRDNESSLRHESELLEETLRLIVQLALSPLRYPTISSSLSHEEWATWLLEREVKHWLSLGPFSRSELISHLDLKLVEQVRQMPRHEWFLLEEEEIIGHVLERAGEYDDPYGQSSESGGELNAATALGFGMKMSGTWRLKMEFWPEISPLFECFSPSESQLCEQNIKKHQLRNRVTIEEACQIPVPSAQENKDYYASAQQLSAQILNSPSLLAVVHTVLKHWVDENTRHQSKPPYVDRESGSRAISENLVVAAIQCLSVAVRLLDDSEGDFEENVDEHAESDLKTLHYLEYQFIKSKRQDFFSQLCLDLDFKESATMGSTSVLSCLQLLENAATLSPDTRTLAQSILQTAASKSSTCRDYVDARKREKQVTGSNSESASESSSLTTQEKGTAASTQQLAKDAMRRRQQEILERMRSQQQKFLSSQASTGTLNRERNNDSNVAHGIDDEFLGDENAEQHLYHEADEDEACLSTEYEDEDEDEDDEWGFPAGHIDLELYFSHVGSAVSQISDRERKTHKRGSRRSRRRTQSRARTDSLGGAEATSSPSISINSLEQDDEAEMEECALCRLPCDPPTDKDSTFGYVAMVQPTSLPHKLAVTADSSALPPLRTTVEISDRDGNVSMTSLESTCNGDAVVWTCGHAIHHSCIKAYIDSLWKQQRASRNPLEALHHHGDERLLSERDLEFLCPVCRRLSNCLIPDVTSLLRSRADEISSSFSLRSASSFGDDPETFDTDTNPSEASRHSFTKWLKSAMTSTAASPFPSPHLSSILSRNDGDEASIVQKRVRKFCAQLKLRSVRSSLQLPLLLSGFADDEIVIDSELRHVADTWGQQFSDWTLLRRCLEVELDLTLCEQDLNGKLPVGALPGRHRLQSLRLLAQTTIAAAMATGTNSSSRSLNSIPYLERSTASTSEVLFGRRVLFAEDDDEIDVRSSLKLSTPTTVPLLSHPHLFEVFSKRLTALLAISATRCAGTSEDYRYTETLLSDVFFSARVVITAQILQALCSAALALPATPQDATSPPRSPASRQTPRSKKIITDFSDVETLSDAMQWTHLLLLRCRLLPTGAVLVAQRASWDINIVEKTVVDHALPLLRRMVLLIQASLPRVLDGDERGGGDPCALCDDLYSSGNAEFSTAQRASSSSRSDLRALMRRLHLPPLRFFFRGMVFSAQQRELCQLWAAQMESKAAVLRRRRSLQLHEELEQASTSLVSLLVPSFAAAGGQERRRLFIDLPKVYMELFIKYSDKTHGQCQRCHQVPQHPAICLFCGDVVCCFSPCCESPQGGRVGECTQHAQACAQGTGAFLLLRACTVILFLGNARRCVWGSLYVDKNGEEDPYLRRGRTLFLAPHRLLALETLLISHGFAQNTAILANTSRRDGRRY